MPPCSYTIRISQIIEVTQRYGLHSKTLKILSAEIQSVFWQDISAVSGSLDNSEYVMALSILNQSQK